MAHTYLQAYRETFPKNVTFYGLPFYSKRLSTRGKIISRYLSVFILKSFFFQIVSGLILDLYKPFRKSMKSFIFYSQYLR